MYKIAFSPHTADIRMQIKASSFKDLTIGAISGMNKVLKKNQLINFQPTPIIKTITIKSINQTVLLIDTLSEILTLSYIYRSIFYKINVSYLSEKKFVAEIKGKKLDDNFGFDEDIKAVTYHEAKIIKKKGQYQITIIFDI